MKADSVMVKQPGENKSLSIVVEEESTFKPGKEESEEHFEAIIKSYQSDIQKLHEKLQLFQQSNIQLRQENIELRIKLSEYENSKELEMTSEAPNYKYKHKSHSRKLSYDSMTQEVQELKEKLIRKKQEYDSVDHKHIGRAPYRKKTLHPRLSEPLVLSACPSLNKIDHHKKKKRSSNKQSKYIPSYTRNLKQNN